MWSLDFLSWRYLQFLSFLSQICVVLFLGEKNLSDYAKCVSIATTSAIREMVAPGLLVMLSPILVGFIFGPVALSGLLAGSLVSGVQIAISASNTGGAWDNAKKYIESVGLQMEDSDKKLLFAKHTEDGKGVRVLFIFHIINTKMAKK